MEIHKWVENCENVEDINEANAARASGLPPVFIRVSAQRIQKGKSQLAHRRNSQVLIFQHYYIYILLRSAWESISCINMLTIGKPTMLQSKDY